MAHEFHSGVLFVAGASIPMGQGGHVPPIFMKGDIHGNVPSNILEVMSFRMSTRVTATVVCCILTQILCVVSQKKLQLLGEFVPRPSTGAPPLDLAGIPRPPVFFYVPPIILWDRKWNQLYYSHGHSSTFVNSVLFSIRVDWCIDYVFMSWLKPKQIILELFLPSSYNRNTHALIHLSLL